MLKINNHSTWENSAAKLVEFLLKKGEILQLDTESFIDLPKDQYPMRLFGGLNFMVERQGYVLQHQREAISSLSRNNTDYKNGNASSSANTRRPEFAQPKYIGPAPTARFSASIWEFIPLIR